MTCIICVNTANASFKRSLQLAEVFAVVPNGPKSSLSAEGEIELVSLKSSSFCVYSIKRSRKHKWREKAFVFDCEDEGLCQEWIDSIQSILSGRLSFCCHSLYWTCEM